MTIYLNSTMIEISINRNNIVILTTVEHISTMIVILLYYNIIIPTVKIDSTMINDILVMLMILMIISMIYQ